MPFVSQDKCMVKALRCLYDDANTGGLDSLCDGHRDLLREALLHCNTTTALCNTCHYVNCLSKGFVDVFLLLYFLTEVGVEQSELLQLQVQKMY